MLVNTTVAVWLDKEVRWWWREFAGVDEWRWWISVTDECQLSTGAVWHLS